jgi:hypothetical protein
MDLATGRRGEFNEMKYLTDSRTTLVFDIPLAEVRSTAWPAAGRPLGGGGAGGGEWGAGEEGSSLHLATQAPAEGA